MIVTITPEEDVTAGINELNITYLDLSLKDLYPRVISMIKQVNVTKLIIEVSKSMPYHAIEPLLSLTNCIEVINPDNLMTADIALLMSKVYPERKREFLAQARKVGK